MNTLTIDKKKYVVIEQKNYEELKSIAARKSTSAKKLSLSDGKKMAFNLIDKWEKEK